MKKIICFSGRARVGKTSAANFLKAHLENDGEEIVKTAIADPLKMAAEALGYTKDELFEKKKDAREILQKLGMLIREYKPEYLMERIGHIDAKWIIVDDIRLAGEVEFFKGLGAVVFYIDRPVPPANQDRTEIEIDTVSKDKFDGVIENYGTLEEFEKTVISTVLQLVSP